MSARRHRLDRIISRHLGISHDAVRLLLAQKRIRVDGELALAREQLVTGFNIVTLDGEVIQGEKPVYLKLHKPCGVLSATVDPVHPVVTSLISHPCIERLHIAGRLDLHSSGLLLLTNDGRWSRMLSDPVNGIDKQYLVTLKNPVEEGCVAAFQAGMYFEYENITTRPAKLELLGESQVKVTLQEGRYHQIKRMFGRFRNPVLSIHRVAIGSLQLDAELQAGNWQELSAEDAWNLERNKKE